jgi:thioredoxin-like negative regulator of GroEL
LRNSIVANTKDKQKMTKISNNQKLTLIEVRANWSGGSHLMDLIVNRIEEQFREQIRVLRIDFEIHKEFLLQFGVENAPAVLFISKGQVVEVISEILSQKNLEGLIHTHLLKGNSLN